MYDLEEEKIIKKIKQKGYKNVLLQLPDGLKPKAKDVVIKIENETDAIILTWFGTNFGACDLPVGLQTIGIDYVVAFGHNLYKKDKEGW